jgi:hypothetical protein
MIVFYLFLHTNSLAPSQNKLFDLGYYFYGSLLWLFNFIFLVMVMKYTDYIYKNIVIYKYKQYMKSYKHIDEMSEIFNMQGFNLNTLRLLTSVAIDKSYNIKFDKWVSVTLSFFGAVALLSYNQNITFYVVKGVLLCSIFGLVIYLAYKKAYYRFSLSQFKNKKGEMLNEQ